MGYNDEFDITRKMLGKLRENKVQTNKRLTFINEGFGESNDYENAGDAENSNQSSGSDAIKPSQEEILEDQNSFIQVIGPSKFTVYNVYPEVGNVVFGGVLDDGMEWQYSLEGENGVYITNNNLQLTDDKVITIQRLKAQFDIWKKDWTMKMVNEYKPKNGNA